MSEPAKEKEWPAWRERLRHVIFDHNTPASKTFDVLLLLFIFCSLIVVMLDTVEPIKTVPEYHQILYVLEWVFTVVFTIEYILRLYISRSPLKYARSFFGIVDLLSCLPAYLALIGGFGALTGVVRTLRLLRVFRVLKMIRFVGEANYLMQALRAARPKITVFIVGIATLVVLLGTLMYVIENAFDPGDSGFTSIPEGIYWAIVTLTTVGFGDVTPVTPLGKFVASIVMLLGYAIIAVPTGIVGAEIARVTQHSDASGRSCPACGVDGHSDTAEFCRMCGDEL